MRERLVSFLVLLGVVCSASAQDALVNEIRTVIGDGQKMRLPELSDLSHRLFKEGELVFIDNAAVQRWTLLLNDAEAVELLRRLCEACTQQIKIAKSLETAELLEASNGIKTQVAVAELVTRTLRQNSKGFDDAKVEDKLQLVIPLLKKLVQQGDELRVLLGADSRAVFYSTSPPPTAAEVAANNAKSLLPHIDKAQEEIMDAVWPVYVRRLKLSREDAIARLVRSGLTREGVERLLKAAYDE